VVAAAQQSWFFRGERRKKKGTRNKQNLGRVPAVLFSTPKKACWLQ
jgi:hypothetical protein